MCDDVFCGEANYTRVPYSANYIAKKKNYNEIRFLALGEIKIEVGKILQVANRLYEEKMLISRRLWGTILVSVHIDQLLRISLNALRSFKSMYRIWMNAFRYLNDHHCKQDIHICLLSGSLKGSGLKRKKHYNDNK